MRFEALVAAALSLVAPHAEGGVALSGSARCDAPASVGRFRCEVEAHAAPGSALRWVDVQLVDGPPWVTILKGRLAGADAVVQTDALWRFAFSAVARERGKGELQLRLRAVVCENTACAPVEILVPAAIRVGTE
jgi:hypothetical protein